MIRGKGDAKIVVETPETLVGKADSADSSFGPTLLKKPKSDFKLRVNQAGKAQAKDIPTSTFNQSMSKNNEAGSPMDVQRDRDLRKHGSTASGEASFSKEVLILQKGESEDPVPLEPVGMHQVRGIILRQEAEFREQVRELHRLHKVQTLLMAEVERKDSGLMAHFSRTEIGGSSESPTAFAFSSGEGNSPSGQVFCNTGYEASIALPKFLKGGSTRGQRQRQRGYPPTRLPEVHLLKPSARVPPARKTFDLERPPDEDDDEQQDLTKIDTHKPEVSIQFIESPESCSNEPEPESDLFSLHLSTGWSRGKAVKDDNEQSNQAEYERLTALKRPRQEAALFPFLAVKSAEGFQDAPVQPTPTVAGQKFLGGFWGLQLGGKLDRSSTPDRNRSPDNLEAPKKKGPLSLNLEVEEKEMPATGTFNSAPHWLRKAPAANPPTKTLCQPDRSSLNFQHSFSSSRNSSDQGLIKTSPQGRGELGSGSTFGLDDSERRVSDNPARNWSQSSNNAPEMSEDNMQGARGADRDDMVNVSPTPNERAGFRPVNRAQGVEEAPGEVLTLHSSWREGGEVLSKSLPHGVFTQSLSIAGGFGLQLKSFDGGLAAQGLLHAGHAVNMATGATQFIAESGPGMLFQQVSSDPQIQQLQPQQQSPSRPTGLVSLSRQGGPWQVPTKISQTGAYGGQGAVFAVPAAAGPILGFPMYGMQKGGEDLSGPNCIPGSVGPPFTPFSVVVPPRPPFKRPPKLVLTHDGTSMELKVVSPEVGAKVVLEKSYSASSGEELNEKNNRVYANVPLNQGRGQDERDLALPTRGRREIDKRTGSTGFIKDKDCAVNGGAPDRIHEVSSTAVLRNSQAGRLQNVFRIEQQEGMDDADGGSSDAGSGGSGVGDVINPGEGGSPPALTGTFVRGGSKRNLPAGEGEEGVHMGELGLQADSESQSGSFNRKDKPSKYQEESQEQFSASLSLLSCWSLVARKISRGSSDGPGLVVDNMQKLYRLIPEGLPDEGKRRAPVSLHHVLEQSGSSSGGIMNLLVKEDGQFHGLCKQQSSDELGSAQLELQQPSCSTLHSRGFHTSSLDVSESQGQESSKGVGSSASGPGTEASRERNRGRMAMDIDDRERERETNHGGQKNLVIANLGDVSKQDRGSKTGHNKQLSGANTSETDGVQHEPCSPGLRQASSPSSTVDMGRLADGSSKKVSQASETDQGNGRSPRRTTEWIGPTPMDHDHMCSPGGIDSSCEEVDGTLTSCNDSSITWTGLEDEVQRTW